MRSVLIRKTMLLVIASFATGAAIAFAQSSNPPHLAKKPSALKLPVKFAVSKSTISPNGRYGVLEPDENTSQNAIIDLRTGVIIGKIRGFGGIEDSSARIHFNPSRWSADSSLLLWEVTGKWADSALILITIRHGKIVSQLDIEDIVSRAADARTKRALRRKHESTNTDYDYVDVHPDGKLGARISLPLKVHASLMPGKSAMTNANLPSTDSEMDALVTASGRVIVTHFKLDDD